MSRFEGCGLNTSLALFVSMGSRYERGAPRRARVTQVLKNVALAATAFAAISQGFALWIQNPAMGEAVAAGFGSVANAAVASWPDVWGVMKTIGFWAGVVLAIVVVVGVVILIHEPMGRALEFTLAFLVVHPYGRILGLAILLGWPLYHVFQTPAG